MRDEGGGLGSERSMKLRVILQGLAICAAVWTAVFAAQGFFRSHRVTAESLEAAVEDSRFEDWSGKQGEPGGTEAESREARIRAITGMINELDFGQSEKAREKRLADEFFSRLSAKERVLFVDLTIEVILARWMSAFEGLPEEDKEKFIKRGVKEFEEELDEAEMKRLEKLGAEMLAKITTEGFSGYLDGMSAEEKMELAPLMETMNELMQRLRMPKWEGRGDQ